MDRDQLLRLFGHVAAREQLVSLGRWFYRFAWGCVIVYAVLFLASRLLAVIPDRFGIWTVGIIPAAALLLAAVFARRPAPAKCARLIDDRAGTKDLFLTAALLDRSPGEFQPLVAAAAADKARSIRPATVVPFQPWRKTGHISIALLVLLLGINTSFQLDPFGKEEDRKKQEDREKKLVEGIKQTEARAEVLKRTEPTREMSRAVESRIEELKDDFRQMKPEDPKGNLQKLHEQQKEIGEKWKELSEKKLAEALKQQSSTQRFGGADTDKSRQIKNDFAAGKTDTVSKELQEIKQLAKDMAKATDPAEREKKKKELEQRLSELADSTKGQGSPGLSEALQRALQQLDMASVDGLTEKAMEGLAETLDLSQAEAQSLAQQLRDIKTLEDAMKALQNAQRANQNKPLDGKLGESCQTMADYEKLYAELMKEGGEGGLCEGCKSGGSCQGGSCSSAGNKPGRGGGTGGGMGGPGRGRGNIAPEDPTIKTDFETQKASAKMRAGRILMQWKTKEVSETGEMKRDFAESLNEVKQHVSEAIVAEEVPPGYHEAIRQYFNTIDQSVVKPIP